MVVRACNGVNVEVWAPENGCRMARTRRRHLLGVDAEHTMETGHWLSLAAVGYGGRAVSTPEMLLRVSAVNAMMEPRNTNSRTQLQ